MAHHTPRRFSAAVLRGAVAALVLLATACTPPKPPALIDLSLVPLVPVETVHTAQVRLITEDRSFEAFFGPFPGMPDEQTDRAAFPVGRAGVPGAAFVIGDTVAGEVFVGAGYSYLWGRHPYGTTTRGAGTSEGSILLIQRDAMRKVGSAIIYVDRFFFLEGTSMTVQNENTPPDEAMTTVISTYIDVDSAGTLYAVEPIPGAGTIFSFVNNVINDVAAAGNPTPVAWPP